MADARIKVLVVDDSAVIRQVWSTIVNGDPGLELIGAVADPLFAMKRMETEWPDIILLDVEMPRMDGITFLRKIMADRPTPVIICSTLTTEGAETTLQALSAGAVEVVAKPKLGAKGQLLEEAARLREMIRAAARSRPRRRSAGASDRAPSHASPPAPKLTADAVLPPTQVAMRETTDRVVAIGTSTGGTQALEEVLTALPRLRSPGMVIVQHMPEKFTAAFAARLNGLCAIEVREAVHGDRVVPGRALIAPGGRHMLLKRSGAQYYVEVVDGPLVSRHRPSVDVLFRSVARTAGRNALGVIMTGMGDDGARGMLEMHQAGAHTVAQDEASCVVFGMPKEAIKLGGADKVIPLGRIPEEIMGFGSR
ncbi:MAG: chemotaxis response regulator protein-glutamate methylesterase [Pseudomonadota bacterium]